MNSPQLSEPANPRGKMIRRLLVAGIASLSAWSFQVAHGDTLNIGFEPGEGYISGQPIKGQGSAGNVWTQGVPAEMLDANVSTAAAHSGTQAFELSNAVLSTSLNSVLSPATLMPAGETGTSVGKTGTGGSLMAAQGVDLFTSDFWFRTVSTTADPGLNINLSLTDGTGARMTYLRISESAGALAIDYLGYDKSINDFPDSLVATNLNWGTWYHLRLEAYMPDGASNDIVSIYLSTNSTFAPTDLKLTNTTWEDLYRVDGSNGPLPAINSISSKINAPAGANTPLGVLFDDMVLSSAVPEPTTAALLAIAVSAVGVVRPRRTRKG